MFLQLLRFIVYSNLFIAGCALLMVRQTTRFLLNSEPSFHLLGFVLFSTICSYSFHWYLTSGSVILSDRIEWLKKNRIVHSILFFIGLAGAACFFFLLRAYWFWLLGAALATFLYSAPKIPLPAFRMLRKVAIGKTIFLAFVWMYVTSILPIIVAGGSWNGGMVLFSISRFFLVYAICILFDYRDREDDKTAGVKSLITFLGERSIGRLFFFSILVFFGSTLAMYWYDYRIIDIVFLLVPGIITALIYQYAKRNFDDFFYYLFLDGLMALSAILMLMGGI